jgi:hypothetical protein
MATQLQRRSKFGGRQRSKRAAITDIRINGARLAHLKRYAWQALIASPKRRKRKRKAGARFVSKNHMRQSTMK